MIDKEVYTPAKQTAAKRAGSAVWGYLRENIAILPLIVIVAFFGIVDQDFLTLANWANIGRQVAMTAIIACGMTMVIVTANIDLSVASTLALAAMLSALTLQATGSTLLALLVALATGVVIGMTNGLLVTKGKIPSFLVTLGTMGIAGGAAYLVTNTQPVVIYAAPYWHSFGDGNLFGVLPIAIFWTIIVLIISHVTLAYTTLGRYIYATGGNSEAALFTGVKTDRTVIISFVITGALAAFAGVILASRMHAARPGTGQGMELDVIAAVILGGTSLFGGKGSIFGSLVGALVIGALNNGLIILGLDTNAATLVRGVVIILAVLFAPRVEKS